MKINLKEKGFSDKDIYSLKLIALFIVSMCVSYWLSTVIAHYMTNQIIVRSK